MEASTFYYTLSVMPQVLAAVAAVTAAVTFFRIENLRDYLIGDGKSVFKRWEEGEYNFPDPMQNEAQFRRLRDGVDRQSVPEIKKVLLQLAKLERDEGHTKDDSPRGLQYLYEDRFCVTEERIDQLKDWALGVVGLSFVSIIACVVSLAFTDVIMSMTCTTLRYFVLWVNIILFAAALGLAAYLMYLGLLKTTKHETDL